MIIALTGPMGSGKTLLLSMFAHKYFSKPFNSTIYANYHLNFPFKTLSMKEITDGDFNFTNSFLAMDEIHQFMDSRLSGTKKNRTIGYFITQSRKRNLILAYTTQQSHQIDKRLRSNTDYFIKCENLSPKDAVKDICIRWTINDMEGHSSTYTFQADPYFGLYDTHQVVAFGE